MKSVWIVDDDDEMAAAISLMLKLLDCEARHFLNARSGAQALLAGQRPDVLILDISMPEVSGIDMLEFVRRRREWDTLPVVMLSSEHTDVQVDKALGLGADAYVFKPVTLDELEHALNSAFEKRKDLSRK